MDFCALHSRYCRCDSQSLTSFLIPICEKKTVNLISGFLGAGKTTMVNQILQQPTNKRIDILVREYGSVSIDDRLLKVEKKRIHSFSGVSFHETRESMLGHYLESLYDRAERHPFDHLLIESSGAENAERLLRVFLQPRLRDMYRVGSFITVVDAEYGLLNLREFSVAREQAVYADVIIINKMDLVSEDQAAALQEALRQLNPCAIMIRTAFGSVSLDKIADVSLFRQLTEMNSKQKNRDGVMNEFQSVSVELDEPLDREKTDAWLSSLFERYGGNLLRGKGLFHIHGSDYRFEFQSVRESFHARTEELWGREPRRTSIVLIGTNVPSYQTLYQELKACIAEY